jgi:hypothetical protein
MVSLRKQGALPPELRSTVYDSGECGADGKPDSHRILDFCSGTGTAIDGRVLISRVGVGRKTDTTMLIRKLSMIAETCRSANRNRHTD